MKNRSDDELIALIGTGSTGAFNELFVRHRALVFGYAFRILGDRARAEDVAQETWIRLVKISTAWTAQGGARSWLATVARRLAIASLRAERRLEYHPADELDQSEDTSGLSRETFEDVLLAQESREVVKAAIAALPDVGRTAITLWLTEDLSYSDIARELSISESAVKSALFRAKERLVRELSDSNLRQGRRS